MGVDVGNVFEVQAAGFQGHFHAARRAFAFGRRCGTQAIKSVFGEHARNLAVSSTKGATGHMLGAAGAVEMSVCALAIKHDIVPPTINYQTPDPECDLDYVPNTAREMKVNAIINNSFGFGGHNASIAAKKFVG